LTIFQGPIHIVNSWPTIDGDQAKPTPPIFSHRLQQHFSASRMFHQVGCHFRGCNRYRPATDFS
jgi:hypothetical protein